MEPKDRLGKLLSAQNTSLNGINFVEIASADQTTLRVHFLNTVALGGTLATIPTITGGETIKTVAVNPVIDADWSLDVEGRPLLTLQVAAPGDFSFYTLTLSSPALDPFYNAAQFSFKALCASNLDCEAPAAPCPALPGTAPPITYLAKDFLSFRKALSDFSALAYPQWQERSEADFGVMFMEALCSLADDLSYTQDRIAAEARIDVATQRCSLVRLARLVDYEPKPALAASVILQLEVEGGPIPSGFLVSATNPDGTSVDFETGTGLIDPATLLLNTATYPVSPNWNRCADESPNIAPYWWDDSTRCLAKGASEMWVANHGFGFTPGLQLLIDSAALNPVDPPVREIVVLDSINEQIDPLFLTPVTHLVFQNPLQFSHDQTRSVLAGNLVPATQGRRYSENFAIDTPPPASHMPLAIHRTGPNATDQYLYSLSNTPLAWLSQSDPNASPTPEIILTEQPADTADPPVNWLWRSRLLDAEEFELSYTVDPMSFVRVAQNSDNSVSYEYDSDNGATIRFGDDIFGEIPDTASVFRVMYRVGGGSAGNVAADAITKIVPNASGGASSSLVTAVTNPFAATGGADEETSEQIARRAPQQFRAIQYRAVLPQDYEAAAQTLPWVERAGTRFRWTGSWLSVFTTADPAGDDDTTVAEQVQLIDLLNRYRLAGYESYVSAPNYVSIDLIVTVCASSSAFAGDVEASVLAVLSDAAATNQNAAGFFFFDNFSFGMPLERSALEAAIQSAYGVNGVLSVAYRERGVTSTWTDLPDTLAIHPDQILRLDNDPDYPERGTLQVVVEGGK